MIDKKKVYKSIAEDEIDFLVKKYGTDNIAENDEMWIDLIDFEEKVRYLVAKDVLIRLRKRLCENQITDFENTICCCYNCQIIKEELEELERGDEEE